MQSHCTRLEEAPNQLRPFTRPHFEIAGAAELSPSEPSVTGFDTIGMPDAAVERTRRLVQVLAGKEPGAEETSSQAHVTV